MLLRRLLSSFVKIERRTSCELGGERAAGGGNIGPDGGGELARDEALGGLDGGNEVSAGSLLRSLSGLRILATFAEITYVV